MAKRENIQKYPLSFIPKQTIREFLDARTWEHDRRESSQKAFSVAVPGLSGFPLAARRCVLSTLLPPTTAGRKILILPVKHTHIGIVEWGGFLAIYAAQAKGIKKVEHIAYYN